MFVIRRLISIESISIDLSSAIDLITLILDPLYDHVLTLLVMHTKEIGPSYSLFSIMALKTNSPGR